jgi:hypothetical protein
VDGNDRLSGRSSWFGGRRIMSISFGRLRWRLVLRIDVAAVDAELASAVNADERAGACDIRRVVNDRMPFERDERRFDLVEPLVHVIRQLVGIGVIGFETVEFSP